MYFGCALNMCGKHLTIAVHLACQICDMHYSIAFAGVGGGTACGVCRMIGIPESQTMNTCVAHLSGNHRKEATTDRILVFSCSVVPSSEAYEGRCIQRPATAPSSGTQLSFVPAALVTVGPWTSSLAPWNSGTRQDARQEGQELISWTSTTRTLRVGSATITIVTTTTETLGTGSTCSPG